MDEHHKYNFQTMTVKEMARAANDNFINRTYEDLTDEEMAEYDAKYGYFDDDD